MQDSSHHSPVVEQEDTTQSHLLAYCQSKHVHVQQLLSCTNCSKCECRMPYTQQSGSNEYQQELLITSPSVHVFCHKAFTIIQLAWEVGADFDSLQ